jgi:hypothetical protein
MECKDPIGLSLSINKRIANEKKYSNEEKIDTKGHIKRF